MARRSRPRASPAAHRLLLQRLIHKVGLGERQAASRRTHDTLTRDHLIRIPAIHRIRLVARPQHPLHALPAKAAASPGFGSVATKTLRGLADERVVVAVWQYSAASRYNDFIYSMS